MGADLTSTDIIECYIACSKSKINSTVQDTEENNVLLPQEPAHNDNDNTLAGAATTLSLLLPPTDNSNSQHINYSHMKCYYACTHHCFLDYFKNPILDDVVIYAGDIPFKYKIEGR